LHLADLAGGDEVLDRLKIFRIAQLVVDDDDFFGMSLGGREHTVDTVARRHDRLFREDVLAGGQALFGEVRVREAGRGEDDRVDVGGDEPARIFVTLRLRRRLERLGEVRRVRIADGGDLDMRKLVAHELHVRETHRAGAEESELHAAPRKIASAARYVPASIASG
jgi:hypothetical protein